MAPSASHLRIPAGGVALEGTLALPAQAWVCVVFAHGSGSGRHSPRNQAVARRLEQEGLGTLLLDLLTPGEEAEDLRTRALRFDIPLLAGRVAAALEHLRAVPATRGLPVGLFGSSTGAAAALVAAAERPRGVGAVVSRGGRPDLAGEALGRVRAPCAGAPAPPRRAPPAAGCRSAARACGGPPPPPRT